MCIDIFDFPSTRSTNRMGTSIDSAAVLEHLVDHLDLEPVPLGPHRRRGRCAAGSSAR